MTTSVRLSPQVEQSLSDYCNRKGITKTQLMSNAIVDYIARDRAYTLESANAMKVREASPIYIAFETSGLIGASGKKGSSQNGDIIDAGSATKARVREVVRARLNGKSKALAKS
jgi:predicted DNA-binding protein